LPDLIDGIDAEILKTLLMESRTSFTEIAKNCKITVGAVRARYKRLWKTGIIKGEIMLVNPFSLGYEYISLIRIRTTKADEEKAIESLKRNNQTKLLGRKFENYNIHFHVALHTIEELSKIQRDLEANPLIKHSDFSIWSDTITPEKPENLLGKPFSGKIEHKPITIKQTEKKMDETDRQIAKILSQKARTPFSNIARQLGISTKKVMQRYKKLRENVLTLSTIVVDLNKLGYTAGVILLIRLVNKSKLPESLTQLLKIPNLIVLVKLVGNYDLFAYVVLKDFQEYFKMEEIINSIQNFEYVYFYLEQPSAWPPNNFCYLLR